MDIFFKLEEYSNRSSISWGVDDAVLTNYEFEEGNVTMSPRENIHINDVLSYKDGLRRVESWLNTMEDRFVIKKEIYTMKYDVVHFNDHLDLNININNRTIKITFNISKDIFVFYERPSFKMPFMNFKLLHKANEFFIQQILLIRNVKFIEQD